MGRIHFLILYLYSIFALGSCFAEAYNQGTTMTTPSSLVIHISPHSVPETVERIRKILKLKEINLFALIDHSGEAQKAGMQLEKENLLIFGDPKVGTYLMQENPAIGIELPLKLLVWKNTNGATQIAYLDPLQLKEAYGITKNGDILKKMSESMGLLVDKVIQNP
jgi:uncharacterized protein (DUF302 family)